jgi:hypothetical protein
MDVSFSLKPHASERQTNVACNIYDILGRISGISCAT